MSDTIYDEVVRDTGIDYETIANRPKWSFEEADRRIRETPEFKAIQSGQTNGTKKTTKKSTQTRRQ